MLWLNDTNGFDDVYIRRRLDPVEYTVIAMNAAFHKLRKVTGRYVIDPYRGFPSDYFIYDLETTGFDRRNDVITQIGWGVVRNRQLVNNEALTLNWARTSYIDQDWFRARLQALETSFNEQGRPYQLTYDVIEASPVNPLDGLRAFDDILAAVTCDNEWILGHNILGFDNSMVDAHRARFLDNGPVEWPPDGMFDVGLFVKAALLGKYPEPWDTLQSFFESVAGIRARGVKWALDSYCVPAFNLDSRFGIDVRRCHAADYDCRTTHLVFESLREIGEAHGQEKNAEA